MRAWQGGFWGISSQRTFSFRQSWGGNTVKTCIRVSGKPTYLSRTIPKAIGIKICSAGTGRIWKTFWLQDFVKYTVMIKSRNRCLQPRNVTEEERNSKSQDCGREDVQVLRRGMLENTEFTAPSGQKVSASLMLVFCFPISDITYPHCIKTKVKK